MHVLLADNDAALATLVAREFKKDQVMVDWVQDSPAAEHILSDTIFDAVLLSWELPPLSGLAVLQQLRAVRNQVPVIMLSETDVLDKRLQSLDAGADDFLAKPFALVELKARLHAVVRRSTNTVKPELRCGSLVFDSYTRTFRIGGTYLLLTPRESSMLAALVEKAGIVISRQVLGELVFCTRDDANRDRIEVVIHRLRKKLTQAGVTIETMRGIGYRLVPTTTEDGPISGPSNIEDDDMRHRV